MSNACSTSFLVCGSLSLSGIVAVDLSGLVVDLAPPLNPPVCVSTLMSSLLVFLLVQCSTIVSFSVCVSIHSLFLIK